MYVILQCFKNMLYAYCGPFFASTEMQLLSRCGSGRPCLATSLEAVSDQFIPESKLLSRDMGISLQYIYLIKSFSQSFL